MKCTAIKLTDVSLMRAACSATMRGASSKMTLERIYKCRHSPIRTQIFWVDMVDVHSFVSVHFVRHKIGVEHFVGTNREDRGGVLADRMTLINHSMLINAEALLNMARKRLCGQASTETQHAMQAIKNAIADVDKALAVCMVRECAYLNGRCDELTCCGNLWKP